MMADATNVPVAVGHKAHTLFASSRYRMIAPAGWTQKFGDFPPVTFLHQMGDLLQVPSSNTGVTQRAMYLRQLTNLGVPLWTESTTAYDDWTLDDIEMGPSSFFHVKVWVFNADSGPDQVSCDKIIDADVSDFALRIKLRTWCMRHKAHLIVKRQVVVLDKKIRYHGRTSQVVNTCRAPRNPRKMREHYDTVTSAAIAKMNMGRLIPRNIRGRWGALSNVESYLLGCGKQQFRAAWRLSFGDDIKDLSDGLSAHELITLMDSMVQDGSDMSHYSVVKSKWLKGATEAVEDDDYWMTMQIASVTRAPIFHFENLLQQLAKSVAGIVQIVIRHAARIFEEFFELDVPFILELDDVADRSKYMGLAVELNLLMATDYFSRILCETHTFPFLWLWVLQKPHYKNCTNRTALARDLLHPGDRIAIPSFYEDRTTQKLVRLFRAEVGRMLEDGTCSARFHQFWSDIAEAMAADTQPAEGENNEIKHIGTIASGIRWPLLSDRCMNRCEGGVLRMCGSGRTRCNVGVCVPVHITLRKEMYTCTHQTARGSYALYSPHDLRQPPSN